MANIVFRGTREELDAELRRIAAMIVGRETDTEGIVKPILMRGANALLSKIQQALIVKSRGGTDEAGIKWVPLKPETVAYSRRITARDKREAGINGRRQRHRGILTADQNKLWKKTFGSRLAQLRAKGVPEGEAKSIAARIAWALVKEAGGQTVLAVFGGRQVDILRDTGELFRSLRPGVGDQPSESAEGQIVRLAAGAITVGTNKKPWHHTGNPSRGLPARPLWPEQIPDAWWRAINAAITRGMMLAAVAILEKHRSNGPTGGGG